MKGRIGTARAVVQQQRISCSNLWEQCTVYSGCFDVQQGSCLSPRAPGEALTRCLPSPCSNPSQIPEAAGVARHMPSSYLCLGNTRRSSREGFEARSSSNPFAFFSLLFHSWSKANKPAMRKAFHGLQRSLLEEVDSSLTSRKRLISFFINISE